MFNNIDIRSRVQAEDVKREIEALKRHAEVEANTILVTVRDNNRVLLEGKVNNYWDERSQWRMLHGQHQASDRLRIA